MFVGLALVVLFERRFRRYKLFGRFWRPDWSRFAHLWRIGMPIAATLAFEVGEELLAAGLLEQKPSVGQRHVYLNPRRAADVYALIDEGKLPPGLSLV